MVMEGQGEEGEGGRREDRWPLRLYATVMPCPGLSLDAREEETTSIKVLKRRGDMGQPCRTPVDRGKGVERVVPTRTAALESLYRSLTHATRGGGTPRSSNTRHSAERLTQSKAFLRSM
jgi:hypothetical protein